MRAGTSLVEFGPWHSLRKWRIDPFLGTPAPLLPHSRLVERICMVQAEQVLVTPHSKQWTPAAPPRTHPSGPWGRDQGGRVPGRRVVYLPWYEPSAPW